MGAARARSTGEKVHSPADSDGEGSVFPHAALHDGHLPSKVAAWPVQYLMAVAVFLRRDAVVRVTVDAVVGVRGREHWRVGLAALEEL